MLVSAPAIDGFHHTTMNASRQLNILAIGSISLGAYLYLGFLSDLRQQVGEYLYIHALLLACLGALFALYRGAVKLDMRWILAFALAFRLVSCWGDPALSDDIYRYVWDGRVTVAGEHPYRFTPSAPELDSLRDQEIWPRINHPELRTIYPPTAQYLFAGLAAVGLGQSGFRLALAGADWITVLLLLHLLRRRGQGEVWLLLYAWNPLVILETAGSGHIEAVGVPLLLAALMASTGGKPVRGGLLWAAAIGAKLVPFFIVPALVRSLGWRGLLAGAGGALALFFPLALFGPAVGSGLFDYAGRWEFNGSLYPLIERTWAAVDLSDALKSALGKLQGYPALDGLPYQTLYTWVWPPQLARISIALLGAGLAVWLFVRGRQDPWQGSLTLLSGLLLLSPTFHPWYVLWALPFAVLLRRWSWLYLAALLPLTYLSPTGPDLWIRLLEFVPFAALWIWEQYRRSDGEVAAAL